MPSLTAPFEIEFMRLALLEVMLLSVMAALLGTQIVLRGLAFFTHAVGGAAFPGLVLAGPAGIPAQLAALATGLGLAAGLEGLGRVPRLGRDAATALLLVAALAIGIVLASDVFGSGAEVDQLLFGTLVGIGTEELATTTLALAMVALAWAALRRSWIVAGFDPGGGRALGLPARLADAVLVAAVAVAAVAAVDAAGALLVTGILVIPAATARLVARSVRSLELLTLAIAALQGVAGLWLAYQLDVPPGPAITALGGALFTAVATARFVHLLRRTKARDRPAGRTR